MNIQPIQNDHRRNPHFKAIIKASNVKYIESKSIGKIDECGVDMGLFSKEGEVIARVAKGAQEIWGNLIQFANNYKGNHIIDATKISEGEVKLIKNPFAKDLTNQAKELEK